MQKNPTLIYSLSLIVITSILSTFISYYINQFLTKPDYEVQTTVCTPSSISTNLVLVSTSTSLVSIPTPKDLLTTHISDSGLAPFKITITNTGRKPLDDVSFYIDFKASDNDFYLQNTEISTYPEYDFGPITKNENSSSSELIHADILNPNDKIILTAIGNEPADIETIAKIDGYSVDNYNQPSCTI